MPQERDVYRKKPPELIPAQPGSGYRASPIFVRLREHSPGQQRAHTEGTFPAVTAAQCGTRGTMGCSRAAGEEPQVPAPQQELDKPLVGLATGQENTHQLVLLLSFKSKY